VTRRPGRRPRRPAAALLTLAVLAASGCSLGSGARTSGSVSRQELEGGSIAKDFDLSGAHFTVGSKEFTEEVILGQIMLYALRAAGARTTDQTGLNGTTIARTALTHGDIDMYWEYAGTGWSLLLQHTTTVRGGARRQFEATARQDAARNGIDWLGPARFGDQYAIARAAHASGPAGKVDSLGQLKGLVAHHRSAASLCGASEFLDRELLPFQEAYGFRFPVTQVHQNAFALDFVNVAKQSPCNFAEVFTTDARLKSLHLKVLKDEKGQFLTQLAALTVRHRTARRYPRLAGLARRIGNALTEDTMIELNGMVDLDGATPQEAALHFLRAHHFIG
jgi:osmoprotectant transport system substrate-binding protein